MKASLLARVAPTLLLGGVLAGGIALPGYAQTAASSAAPSATTATNPSAGTSSSTSHVTTVSRSHKTSTTGQSMQQVVDQRIAELHAKLHITKEQEPQWQQFTQVMRDNAAEI